MSDFIIRPAKEEDAQRLLEIYGYYVLNTAVTFEWDVPSLEEFKARIRKFSAAYPYLVCEVDGVIQGYAYAHAYSERKAYSWTVESSIYVNKDFRSKGLGRALYEELEKGLAAQGIRNIIARVAFIEKEDEYLSHDSVKFHHKMGYKTMGCLSKVGFKFDRWYDMTAMQKDLY